MWGCERYGGAPTGWDCGWGRCAISLISLCIFASLTSSCRSERTNVGEYINTKYCIYQNDKIKNTKQTCKFYCGSKSKRLRNENIRNRLFIRSAERVSVCECICECECVWRVFLCPNEAHGTTNRRKTTSYRQLRRICVFLF